MENPETIKPLAGWMFDITPQQRAVTIRLVYFPSPEHVQRQEAAETPMMALSPAAARQFAQELLAIAAQAESASSSPEGPRRPS